MVFCLCLIYLRFLFCGGFLCVFFVCILYCICVYVYVVAGFKACFGLYPSFLKGER